MYAWQWIKMHSQALWLSCLQSLCFSGSHPPWSGEVCAAFGFLPSEPLRHLACERYKQEEDAFILKSWQIPGPDLMEDNVKKAVWQLDSFSPVSHFLLCEFLEVSQVLFCSPCCPSRRPWRVFPIRFCWNQGMFTNLQKPRAARVGNTGYVNRQPWCFGPDLAKALDGCSSSSVKWV